MKKTFLLSIALILASELFADLKKEDAPALKSSIAFFVENDFRFSDRYYTNGLKLTYTDPGHDWWASFLQYKALSLFALSDEAQVWQTASIGNEMYVPYDINLPNPPLNDRPYAGWTYLSSGAHIVTKDTLDSLTVSLGIVGPQSYAGDLQKAYHDIIGADKPMGWDYQIKNEPGIIIAYNHSQRIYTQKISENFSADFIGSLGANLGNVSTEARVKALFRIGFNMPNSFEANRIERSSGQTIEFVEANQPDWHLYLYWGGTARFIGYDITLDGNTFADSRYVARKWLVGESNLGISARYEDVELNLNWIVRTQDFNNQYGGPHIFWCASLRVCF